MIKIDIDETIVNNFYNGVKEYIGIHLFVSNQEKDYFTDEKIEEIIKCEIDNFQKIIDEINSLGLNQEIIKKAFVGDKSNYFGYKKFSKKATKKENEQKVYRAYNLSEVLNIDVCPYCNKNYTYTIVNKTHQYTRPDFDHFLAKKKYPYFAMSFYNLIPSCQVCNRTLKLRKEFLLTTHLHPYKDDFNSIKKFTTTKPLLLCNNEKDFEIKFKDKSEDTILLEKANKNIEDFALPLQYNKHKDIVLELKNRYELYNDDSIKNILKDTEVFKKKGEEYIKSLIMCSSTKDKDINKRPLSKLIKDISEELELI
ncbi:hypothetical protein [Aliarcobacter butzleri]|uniref:HNH domain-containing protein n=1 Tax=Aliarcobacter butzleri L348 TaxID=1447256 RepID=A0A0G9JNL5_9BACT|nr:hypothetical protein [Aliarcobacter butzleri]KLD95861.1 hypothetical protein AA20_13225 [Aliarcobacter butzleri L348]